MPSAGTAPAVTSSNDPDDATIGRDEYPASVDTSCEKGGHGQPSPEAVVPATLLDLLAKSATLQPVVEGDANPHTFIPELLAHYRAGRFPFDRSITKYPFSRINQAMNAVQNGEASKPVMIM